MASRLQAIPDDHAVVTRDDTIVELKPHHHVSKYAYGLNTVLELDESILCRHHSRDDAAHRERQMSRGQSCTEREVDALTKDQLQKHATVWVWQAQSLLTLLRLLKGKTKAFHSRSLQPTNTTTPTKTFPLSTDMVPSGETLTQLLVAMTPTVDP